MFESRKKEKIEEIDIIKSFYTNILKEKDDMDDITWDDLNMDEVFTHIDDTRTTSGQHMLYKILRSPKYNNEILDKRDEVVTTIQENDSLSNSLKNIFNTYRKSICNMEYIFLNHGEVNQVHRYKCIGAILLSIVALLLVIAFNSSATVVLFVVAIVINTNIYEGLNSKYSYDKTEGAKYLGKMLVMADKLSKIQCNALKDELNRLKEISDTCSDVRKKSALALKLDNMDLVGMMIDYITLTKFFNLFSMIKCMNKYKEELLEIYTIIGEIDAVVSVATYRDSLEYWSKPQFNEENRIINVKDLYHPLIENPIPNSLSIENSGIIITGSNMSGKSTFLRTIGINTILAQTIFTSLSKSYTASFYYVVSSISLKDDIEGGKSYYLCEAEAIKRMIDASQGNVRCLALIDEIFKGTNPVERINAAAEIMGYLSKHRAMTLVATHDIALTKMVEGYDNYYFREDVVGNQFKFDYLIKKGVSPTRNAVKILEFIGYPKELINNINLRIK